jgi:dolichyl-phosphate-mannose--protein O-mannosyl transferase
MNESGQVLVSYRTLRRVVGVLGVSLPVIVAVWGFVLCQCLQVLPSISDYYGLRTRDAFVGILFTIAWFLFTYRGYEWQDDVAGNLACVFALAVALFPNSGTSLERVVHFGSALAFFLVLSYFSLFLFTKSEGIPTPQKRVRNVIYRVCGITILLCLAGIGLYYAWVKGPTSGALQPVFWLESVALWAFGISWFIKGDTLFRDRVL